MDLNQRRRKLQGNHTVENRRDCNRFARQLRSPLTRDWGREVRGRAREGREFSLPSSPPPHPRTRVRLPPAGGLRLVPSRRRRGHDRAQRVDHAAPCQPTDGFGKIIAMEGLYTEWDEWAQTVYLVEISRHSRYGLHVIKESKSFLGQRPPDPREWLMIQTFLSAVANVSKLLGPDTARRKSEHAELTEWRSERKRRLRQLLQITTNSPVLQRSVRNICEHFDEHLDKWVTAEPRPTADELERRSRGGRSPVPFRTFDSETHEIVAAHARMSLWPVVDELQRILAMIEELCPLARSEDPGLAFLMSAMGPFPPELRFNAPSRRPEEDIRTCQVSYSGPLVEDNEQGRQK
jgi:hypothetical protein